MDILLIDPPYNTLKGVSNTNGYNIGVTSLAAYLRQNGVETGIVSGDLLTFSSSTFSWLNFKKYAAAQHQYEAIVNDPGHVVWKKLADIVNQMKPKAVGVSYLTPCKCSVERVVSLVKGIDPGIRTVVGSFHPTFCAEEVLQNHNIDFVIRGEGEIPLLSLVQEMKKDTPNWDRVPGLSYQDKNGQIRSTPDASPIQNLDELPFPARDLVLNCDYGRYRSHSLCTVRGCPYTCSFCADRRLWGGRVRRRSVGKVIEEIQLLKDTYKIRRVGIADGTFTYDRNYLIEFCKAMINHKLNVKWVCTARYDNLDEELLELMKESQCSGIYLGMESGSPRVLDIINKRINVEQIVKISKMVYKSGIPSAAAIVLGLPYETKEDIQATLRLMKMIKIDMFDVNTYVPVAGTTLYDSMSDEERHRIDWGKVTFKSLDNYYSKVPHDDFVRLVSEAYKIASHTRTRAILRWGPRMLLSSD